MCQNVRNYIEFYKIFFANMNNWGIDQNIKTVTTLIKWVNDGKIGS